MSLNSTGIKSLLKKSYNQFNQSVNDGLLAPAGYGNMEIRLGRLKDVSRVLIHGFNLTVDGTENVICAPEAGVVGPPAVPDYTIQFPSASTVILYSTSTLDTSGGTGAQIVQVSGLDSNYNPLVELVTMNGVNATTATTGIFIAINEMIVGVSGNTNTNQGAIYLTLTGVGATAGIPTSIYHGIEEGWGFSQTGIYTVPLGYTLFMNHIQTTAGGATDANPAVLFPMARIGGVDLIFAKLFIDRGASDYPLFSAPPIVEKSIVYCKCSRLQEATAVPIGFYWQFNLVKTSSYSGIN